MQKPLPGSERPVLERFIAAAGGREAFRNTGCLPAAGFLGPSLYWLNLQDALPDPPVTACFVPDAVVSFLTGATVVCEPTLAGSSGIFDIRANCWDSTLLEAVGAAGGDSSRRSGAPEILWGVLRRELAEACRIGAGDAGDGCAGGQPGQFSSAVRRSRAAVCF